MGDEEATNKKKISTESNGRGRRGERKDVRREDNRRCTNKGRGEPRKKTTQQRG